MSTGASREAPVDNHMLGTPGPPLNATLIWFLMLSVVFIGFWLAGPGPVRVDRAALGCNSSLFSMDVVFLFISFWLAGPGPVRVDRATLECNSYMVSYAFGGFHWFLAGWPRPGPGKPGRP